MSASDAHTPRSPDPTRIATPSDFGGELSLAKEAAGLTVRQLANKSAVPRATIQGYLSGDHLPQPNYLSPLIRILEACGQGGAQTLDLWVDALTRARRVPGRRPASSPQPYRGLTSFDQQDAAWFFGREDLAGEIADRVAGQLPGTGGPLIVVGPSGAGKSSLLRAGVIPELRKRGRAPAIMTPGLHPARNLADVLSAETAPATQRVLVVDQFEEIFARELTDDERQDFIDSVCTAETAVVIGMRADFYPQALRHSLLAAAMQRDQIVVGPMSAVELRRVIVEPARRAKLDVEPGLVELVLRDLLPRTSGIASRGAHDAGALPLLSHALQAAWERHRGSRLAIGDYLAGGAITGSIAQSADAVLAGLSQQLREVARRLFLRLVRTDEDIADTRRRIALSDLFEGREPAEIDDYQDVLDRFTEARLLTVDIDAVEITHEALLTTWPQLLEWLDADRDWLRLHRRIAAAAEQWREAERDSDQLYRGARLHIAREWVVNRGYRRELNAAEREFFDASERHQADWDRRERRRVGRRYRLAVLVTVLAVVAASGAIFARQQQRTNEREQTQTLSRLVADESDQLRGNDVALSMQLALAAYRISPTPEALSSLLDSTGVTPDTQLRPVSGAAGSITVGGEFLAAGTGNGTIQLWKLAADDRTDPVDTLRTGDDSPIFTIALSKSGGILAAGQGTNIYVWNTSVPARARALGDLRIPSGTIVSLAISQDGLRLAAGTSAGDVWLWNLANPAHAAGPAELTGPTETVESVAFSPDGRTLAAGSDDSTVHLWQVADPGHPTALSSVTTPNSVVFAVAISPDGRTLAAGTSEGHDVYLWNIADPVHPASTGPPLIGPGDWVNSVAFSPDGRSLAAGSSDGLLWIFDLASRQAVRELPHPQPVSVVQYLPDGTPVTLTVDDGFIHLWHLPGPVITGARDGIFAVSFDAGGQRLGIGAGADDDTLTVWNATDPQDPVKLGPPIVGAPGRGRFSGSGALAPDGRTFAVGDVNGTIQLWNISNPAHPVRLGAPIRAASKLIESVNYDQAGDVLAVSSDDGTVHLYSVSAPNRPVSLSTIATPQAGEIFQSAFSPDGRLLVAASSDGEAYLYNIGNRAKPVLVAKLGGFTDAAYSAAFDSSGTLLAVGSADGTVRLWDTTDAAHPDSLGTELSGPVGYIYSMAFAAATNVLAISGNENGTIWIWDLTNPRQPVHTATVTGPSSGVFAVTFSPNGQTLVAGGVNHTVQIWTTNPLTAATWICSIVGQPITRTEWTQYIPGQAYEPPCT